MRRHRTGRSRLRVTGRGQHARLRSGLISWVAGVGALALTVTLAVVSSGFDSREIPRQDPAIWVERSAGQYARVNTQTAEIDTVRTVSNPSGVVQTAQLGLLLTQGFGHAYAIDPTLPADVLDDAHDLPAASAPAADLADVDAETTADHGARMRTPDGTRQVIAAGEFVLFFAQDGSAYLSRVIPATPAREAYLSPPTRLDPLAKERPAAQAEDPAPGGEAGGSDRAETGNERQRYLADAVAMDERGLVAMFSAAEHAIRWYDAAQGSWRNSPSAVPAEVPADQVQLTIAGGEWAMLDAQGGRFWRQGKVSVELGLVGRARLQAASESAGVGVFVADEGGLWRVGGESGAGGAERVVTADGVPAQPRAVAGDTVAAWISNVAARMWHSVNGELSLPLDDSVEDFSIAEPEIRSNGSSALIVERLSGMIWTVPEGTLIPVAQWSLADPPKHETGTVVTQDVTEQEPPVAVADAFGVRAGESTLLPVLLNDYDPNRADVLTIVPESFAETEHLEFGTLAALSDGQGLVLHTPSWASGTMTFSYAVTDGFNVSQPAQVTITVADEDTNTAPQWCPVAGCQREWPSPELTPGGTLMLSVLEAWVDAEGDPMFLESAEAVNPEDALRAVVTADGRLAVRHTDANVVAHDGVVRLRVVDARGAASERDLRIRIRQDAALGFAAQATTVKLGESLEMRPLDRVSGGSGAFLMVDAVAQQGALTVVAQRGTDVIHVVADAAGMGVVAVTVRDTVTEQELTGLIRLTAVSARQPFAVPPLRAFVRPLADSTVDVLASIPGSNSRAVTLHSATVSDGQLRADVIEHSRVRVSGATVDGQPGRIGAVDLLITEDGVSMPGRLTVFQMAEAASGVIAVTDTATVRAGAVVDIAVLGNDVASPGERLVLHPEVEAPGASGELAFASGSRVRYLAPHEPGSYTLRYTVYEASRPEFSDVGQVKVTVLPVGANRNPLPGTLTVRVAPGEQIQLAVPLSGLDPDGDRLRLVAVASPADAQLTTHVLARSNAIQVGASASARSGTQQVSYTVRDAYGGETEGQLRIIVTEPGVAGGAPVAYSDYVRMMRGAHTPAVLRPLENDLDPTGGELELVAVVPNVPGGKDSTQYRELERRLDRSRLSQGIVAVAGADELGTVSFTYTVRSTTSKSTVDGLIVVQVSERIGQQAPTVSDTVLSVRDRAELERGGIDVVSNRVHWSAGDTSRLRLSLWNTDSADYRVQQRNIIGSYHPEGDLVPFRLAGVDLSGAEVETFGFLIVPPLDELRLSLQPGAAALSVVEGGSIDAQIATFLDLGANDTVELDQGRFSTQRPQASCLALDRATIRYTANTEAPWTDSCTVRVRLIEQTSYTVLPIPINIMPDRPTVQLHPLTRTIAPGASERIDLTDMVQWQGNRSGNLSGLRWQIVGDTSAFDLVSAGAQLQVRARADAISGTGESLSVQVTGAGDSESLLTLRVGEAQIDAPRGGTVSLQCVVGAECSTNLTGVSGEYDPFAGKNGGGLQVVAFDDGGCQFGAVRVADNRLRVSWDDPRSPGGQCTAHYTVRDAQNRTGTGLIELDLQGVPRAPESVEATGADATSVTLTVTLNSQTAHPAVTGVEILDEAGTPVAGCAPVGSVAVCPVADVPAGKANGRRYLARAVNQVGFSDPTANPSALTWAHLAPPPPTVTAEALKHSSHTDQVNGLVKLMITGSDQVSQFLLSIDAQPHIEIGRNDPPLAVPAGPHTFTVIAQEADLPPGYISAIEGLTGTASATVGAAPTVSNVVLNDTSDQSGYSATLTHDAVNENYADPASISVSYGVSPTGGGQTICTQPTPTFSGLTPYRSYIAAICVVSETGTTLVETLPVWIGGTMPALQVTTGYTIGGSASGEGTDSVREYTTVVEQPTISGKVAGAVLSYAVNGSDVGDTLAAVPVGGTVTVRQCATGADAAHCSAEVAVPAAGPQPTRVTWNETCIPQGADDAAYFTIEGRAASEASFTRKNGLHTRISWSGFSPVTFEHTLCP